MKTVALTEQQYATVRTTLQEAEYALNAMARKRLNGAYKDSYEVASLVRTTLANLEIMVPSPDRETGQYYLHCEGVAAFVRVPHLFSSEQWGLLQNSFCNLAVPNVSERSFAYVHCLRFDPECSWGSVAWHEELAGPGGMSFLLFPSPNTTDAEIKTTKKYLKQSRDVVRMTVLRTKRWENDNAARIVSEIMLAG